VHHPQSSLHHKQSVSFRVIILRSGAMQAS
jgi:hypothetical protein